MKTEDYKRRGILRLPGSCRSFKKTNEWMSAAVTIIVGIVFGFFIGVSFPDISPPKLKLVPSIDTYIGDKNSGRSTQTILNVISVSRDNVSTEAQKLDDPSQIFVPTNPRGAERLPPAIVASESDFYPRRLYGRPSEDPTFKPKYLVTFTVGYDQKDNIDQAVKKFSDNFTILLFHYDGRTTEWDEFAWSKRAIHISVPKQTKWWYAKRFLHPDIVAPYDFIFIWDEDLGVENFDAEEYIKLVKKHKLEISQPGLDLKSKGLTWHMTKRQEDLEVHKKIKGKPRWCTYPHLPPCAAFVEIMAPVFSRETWRCVWYLIQNDLVHGWGLDFALQKCVEPAYERIGVVDAQWIVHQGVPSLGNQGNEDDGKARWRGVRERCKNEWKMFQDRVYKADEDYYKSIGVENMVPEANWVNMDKVQ
ncbi:hypothetical protein HanRHA438_Chr08g0328501 [Helianthus annuus]|uniref:Trimethylguanosine synthase n=1 Tax=Helianthus annuus TaxID=4232 RepID=A0A251U489_HELAN|nr:uncharacterized protein LOC110871651 isoform X1 [Helianthus annuus]XP_021976061.1 uncharacterized protein LOC110871651 isoform X1 [Helianthus annuus]KAF5793620.1 hypothetical protein HanXRQr2_Chr08g0318531 [Helianthus annuus]KAJ0895903.1 hypothetical protein HanRHA438_Chr08g0328501 [Helianthus annuus]KAJ0899935.1 hypothetical protein HanPSC8_Chr08g0307791 [Helianthus annuus]